MPQCRFLRSRAELIVEVESTMTAKEVAHQLCTPPYLHVLESQRERRRVVRQAESIAHAAGAMDPAAALPIVALSEQSM